MQVIGQSSENTSQGAVRRKGHNRCDAQRKLMLDSSLVSRTVWCVEPGGASTRARMRIARKVRSKTTRTWDVALFAPSISALPSFHKHSMPVIIDHKINNTNTVIRGKHKNSHGGRGIRKCLRHCEVALQSRSVLPFHCATTVVVFSALRRVYGLD